MQVELRDILRRIMAMEDAHQLLRTVATRVSCIIDHVRIMGHVCDNCAWAPTVAADNPITPPPSTVMRGRFRPLAADSGVLATLLG